VPERPRPPRGTSGCVHPAHAPNSNPMTNREALQRLVDELPEADVALTERMLRAMAAPLDDEPDDDDFDGGLTAARDEPARDKGIPHDEVLRRFGLKWG